MVGRGTTAEITATVRSITEAGYAPVVLDRLSRLARRTVGADQAFLLVRDRVDPRAVIAVSAHDADEDVIGRRFGADEGMIGEVLRSGRAMSFDHGRDLPEALWDALPCDSCAGGCAAIDWDGVSQGVLVAATAEPGRRFGRTEFTVLCAIAEVAGAAIEHSERREHSEETVRARVESLSAALELRDRDTGRHVAEVVDLALEVGRKLELSAPALMELEFAAQLHDVGKIAVPDPILRKPAALTEGEWAMMRRHPEWGSGMLAHIPGLEAVAIVVRFHHERWDGSGYPDGLEGDHIPLASRIVAVCDAYNAITAHRAYREGRAHDHALEELRRCSGEQFDPVVVEAFIESAGRTRA